MAWPVSQDYNEAIQDPQSSFHDAELKAGEATTNALGMPMPRSGNFADVYEFNCTGTNNKWAIKCFTRHVSGLRERYMEISRALVDAKLPFTVEFQYLVQGIRVRGEWFPILKMRWVEGLLLNEFVRDNLDKPALLGQLGTIWGRMAKRLRDASIAHADLQHGNVLLVPGAKNTSLAVKLIDYDGMFVPALAKSKSGEVGHPNYQHPVRLREGTYNGEVDRFPLLVVATSLRALSLGGRELWDRYDNGDNLLFKEVDLKSPEKSGLIKELSEISDPQLKKLVDELKRSIPRKLEEVPAIDELLPETKSTSVRAATKIQEAAPVVAAVAAETVPAEEEPAMIEPRRDAGQPKSKVPMFAILGIGAVAAFLVLGVLAASVAFVMLSGKRGQPVVQNPPNADKKDLVKNDDRKPPFVDPAKDQKKDKDLDNKDNKIAKPPVNIPIPIGAPVAFVAALPRSDSRVVLSMDGRHIAFSTTKSAVFGYREGPTFEQEREAPAIASAVGPVQPIGSTRDGRKMALAADTVTGPVVYIWDWPSMKVETRLSLTRRPDVAVFSPNGDIVLCANLRELANAPNEYWLEAHEAYTGRFRKKWQLNAKPSLLGFTPDGTTAFHACAGDPMARTWIMRTNAQGALAMPSLDKKRYLSSDFTKFTVVEDEHQIHMHEFEGMRSIGKLSNKQDLTFHGLAYSADNKYLLVGTNNLARPAQACKAMLVDLKDGRTLTSTDAFAGIPAQVDLAANGIALLQGPDLAPRLYRFPSEYVSPPAPPPSILALKGKLEATEIITITKNPGLLSADGAHYMQRNSNPGTFGYRTAPDFATENIARVSNVPFLLSPLASSVDGKRTAFGAGDANVGHVLLWNWNTNRVERDFTVASQPHVIVISPNQRHILVEMRHVGAGPRVNRIALYDVATGREIKNWKYEWPTVTIGFTPDSAKVFFGVLTEPNVQTYDIADGSVGQFSIAADRNNDTFSPDFSKVARKRTKTFMEVVDVASNGVIASITLPDEKTQIHGCSFSPDGRFLLAAVGESGVKSTWTMLVDLATNKVMAVTPAEDRSGAVVTLGANGTGSVSGGGRNPILYRYPLGEAELVKNGPPVALPNKIPANVGVFKGKVESPLIVEFDPKASVILSTDGERLAYRAQRSSAFRYRSAPDFAVETEVKVPGVNFFVEPFTSFPDGKKMVLVTGTNDTGSVLIWNWAANQVDSVITTTARPQKVVISPDQRYMVVETVRTMKDTPPEFQLTLYEINGARQIKSWSGKAPTRTAGFTPDSSKAFFWFFNTPILEAHSVTDGAPANFPFTLGPQGHWFCPDFSRVARTPNASVLEIVDVASNGVVNTLKSPDNKSHFRYAAFSTDGRFVLASVEETHNLPDLAGRGVLIDVKSNDVVAATPTFPKYPSKVQLGANGVGVFTISNNPTRLYRFPIGDGAVLVRNPPVVVPPVAPGPDGFVSLFNGKDLTGWVPSPKRPNEWQVVNGALTHSRNTGHIYTARDDYQDFHLRIEGRMAPDGIGSVSWRCNTDYEGYNLQFDERANGLVMAVAKNKVGTNIARSLPGNRTLAPTGQWFTLEVIVTGNRHVVKLDGKTMTDAVDSKNAFSKGRIGIASSREPMEFRKIEIKEPAPGANPPQVVTKGFTPLFNGKDLTGWLPHPKLPGEWRVVNGMLTNSKNVGYLYTTRDDFKDYHLRLEGRMPPKGLGGVQWRSDLEWQGYALQFGEKANGLVIARVNNDKGANVTRNLPGTPTNAPTGQWFTLEVIATGDRHVIKLDGKTMTDVVDPKPAFSKGRIGVHGFLEPIEFRKVEIKELNASIPVVKVKDPKIKEVPPPAKLVRLAVPDAEKIAEAQKAIHEQYDKEFAQKNPAGWTALAEKLFLLSKDTADDPAGRYALLKEASSLATKAGSVNIVMKTTSEMVTRFDVDETTAKVDAFIALSKANLNADSSKQFIETALSFAAGAVADDHFDVSTKVLTAAEGVARRSKNNTLLTQVQKQETQSKAIAKEHADMKGAMEKLAADANDPAANLVAGSYLAFRKGDFDKGLPFLARSSNAEFQDLAKKDGAVADDDKARVEMGDAWWSAADKKAGQQKQAMQWRAGHWYRQALPHLTGLTEKRIASRVKQIDDQPAPFRVVSLVAEVDRYKGHVGTVNHLKLAADGKRVFSAGADGTVREWNFVTGKARVLIGPQFSKGPVMDFAFSQDERMIALLSSAYKLSVLNLPSLTPTKSSRGDRDALPGMYWLSDTKLCHSVKGDWHTWDPIGGGASWGAAVLGPGNNRPTVRGLIVSPDQDMAAAMAIGGPVSMVRLADSGGRFGNGNIDFDATTGAFSKDGKFIALGAKDGVLKVFNVRANNPNEVVSLVGHKGMIRAIAFTPDGQKIVSGGDDRMLRVWDAATGKELHRYPHPGTVISLVTTADNRYVISACGDSIIRMWSLSAAGDMAASK